MINMSEGIVRARQFWKKNPLGVVVILGPTASGKTSYSIEMAKVLGNIEIISVDSRQVYKQGDIASGKISLSQMQGIVHHGLNLLEAHEGMNAWEFAVYAEAKIQEIQARKNYAVLCGGTMLWLAGLVKRYGFTGAGKKIQQNPMRKYLLLGVYRERKVLYERINKRCREMIKEGLVGEAWEIFQLKNIHHNLKTMVGYDDSIAYMMGQMTQTEMLRKFQQRTRKYAKRQLTWWRKQEDITWIGE